MKHTLKSMVEFIKKQERSIPNELTTAITSLWDRLFCQRIVLYARFLSKTSIIGYFVPCDLDGKILEKPDHAKVNYPTWGSEEYKKLYKEYQEACDRVLFKGFECTKDKEDYLVKNGDLLIYFFDTKEIRLCYGLSVRNVQTLEDLTKYNLELTDSAIKQFM